MHLPVVLRVCMFTSLTWVANVAHSLQRIAHPSPSLGCSPAAGRQLSRHDGPGVNLQ